MGARQLDHFGQRLRRDQLAGKIERGVGVHAGRLDDFEAVIGGALGRRRIGGLENVGGLFRGRLHLLVGVLGLRHAAFGEFTERSRHLDLGDLEFRDFELRHFECTGRGLARLHSLGVGGCGFRHDTILDLALHTWGCLTLRKFWLRRPLRAA